MVRIDIDINQSPSGQSSNDESASVENNRKSTTFSCSVARGNGGLSTPGSDNAWNSNRHAYKYEENRFIANRGQSVYGHPDDRICPTPLVIVDTECSKRSVGNKGEIVYMPKTPQEKSPQNARTYCADGIDIDRKNNGKGKGKFSQSAKSESSSKGQNDSYESVESTSSKKPFSVGKRVPCFDTDTNSGWSKRPKMLSDDGSFSSPVIHHGRSFFNWITNIASVTCKSVEPEKTSILPPDRSLNDGDDLGNTTGFKSFVEALYHTGVQRMQPPQAAGRDHKEEVGLLTMNQSHRHGRGGFKVLQSTPSPVLRTDDSQFGEFPPEDARNTPSSNSPIQGTLQIFRDKHCHERNRVASSSSMQSLQVPNKSSSSRFSSGGSEFLGSAWITRLCSRSAQRILTRCNQDRSSAADRPVPDGKYTTVLPSVNHLIGGNPSLVLSKNQYNTARDQEQITGPSSSSFLKGDCMDSKLKCMLNPIVPSPATKKLEPITSIFAKRLDALRQIKSVESVDPGISNSICLFCGTCGHDVGICPEVPDQDRIDLLKSITSCGWPGGATSLCIICFRLNHWAVACPYAYAKSKRPSGNVRAFSLEFDKKQNDKDVNFYSAGRASILRSADDNGQKLAASKGYNCGESSTSQADCSDPMNFRNSISIANSRADKLKDESQRF